MSQKFQAVKGPGRIILWQSIAAQAGAESANDVRLEERSVLAPVHGRSDADFATQCWPCGRRESRRSRRGDILFHDQA